MALDQVNMRNDGLILDEDNLLFRRQFILGPYFVERFKTWQKSKISNSLFLTAHPDLQLCRTMYDGKSLTLLGYILDPENPESNDLDIMNRLIRQAETFDDVLTYTHSMGGRWILVLHAGKEIRLLNDATGLRQVFYTTNLSQRLWCASQPGIIAEQLDLEMDRDAVDEFINSPTLKLNHDYWWPGVGSPFKEIRHLLPNHYLDLKTGACHRYWPNKYLDRVSVREGAKHASQLIGELIRSARNRFQLALPITAGWDSRVLLAACKAINASPFCYTLTYDWGLTEDSPDVRIPAELLPQLGLEHHIIRCPSRMDDNFAELYRRNVTTAHDEWGVVAQGLYEYYPEDAVCVKANGGEVSRSYYRLAFFEKLNAENLARLTQMSNNPFAIRHFEKWLSQSRGVAERYNINVLDLFYWEQRMGNWQAMSQLEWDIAQEVFTPYNCRSLLETMLSVEEQYRRPPDHKLFEKIIMNLCPSALMKPINPTESRSRCVVKRILMKANLLSFVRRTSVNIRRKLTKVT